MQRANYYHVVTLPENCLIHLCIGHSQSWDQSTKNHSIMWTYVCASRITKTVFFFRARCFFRMLILSMGRARFAARGLLSCSHTAKWNCQRFIYVLAAHSLEAHRPNTIVWCEHTCAQRIQRKYFFWRLSDHSPIHEAHSVCSACAISCSRTTKGNCLIHLWIGHSQSWDQPTKKT
jgi:hypothetical protein